jgi:serine/threonine-protein phosphatase 2A regulatory subunit B'
VRERDFLKTITHRIYSKLTQRRALIRRVICNVFYEFILETGENNGVGAMLEILASVINGFAVPIKEEHKTTLVRALIPLHKAHAISSFHPQLTYCMALYASKEHTLTRVIVPGLLRYWPNGAAQKQMMFLNELEDIISGGIVDTVSFTKTLN